MRIVYLGTPEFAVEPLKSVCAYKNAEVIAVVCNRDKPVGRKKIMTAPPVKVYAQSRGIPVYQYDKIRKEGVSDMLALKPDLMITCAFGQILSQEILDIPKLGVINIHASLLPKYRGASPINYAILNGEKQTGITVMKTDVGIDTGATLLQKRLNIGERETAGELFQRLSVLGAEAITEALALIENGSAVFVPQDDLSATYSKIIKKEDALIDFNAKAEDIVNLVRAYNPAPVAYAFYKGEAVKIYSAEISSRSGEAGSVVSSDGELIIAASEGAVKINTIQKAGGKVMSVDDFLRGNKISVGDTFEKC